MLKVCCRYQARVPCESSSRNFGHLCVRPAWDGAIAAWDGAITARWCMVHIGRVLLAASLKAPPALPLRYPRVLPILTSVTHYQDRPLSVYSRSTIGNPSMLLVFCWLLNRTYQIAHSLVLANKRPTTPQNTIFLHSDVAS